MVIKQILEGKFLILSEVGDTDFNFLISWHVIFKKVETPWLELGVGYIEEVFLREDFLGGIGVCEVEVSVRRASRSMVSIRSLG